MFESILYIVFFGFLLLLIGLIFHGVFGIIRDLYGFFYANYFPVHPELTEILQSHQPFYKQLNSAEKRKFEQRVKVFMFNKKFIPRQMPEVTEEMKVLISASAIQLTFGLNFSFFRHFNKILVYSDSYYSAINKTYHNGEVNPKLKAIIVSWKHFVSGYMIANDGRNLGLHEMAHAIKLENRVHPMVKSGVWNQFIRIALHYLSAGPSGLLFRNYGFTNIHEFFAVAVENFFERPGELSNVKPELYQCLTVLLNQDPLHRLKK